MCVGGVELPREHHPRCLVCEGIPEFTATPREGHAMFFGFVRAAREFKAVRDGGKLTTRAEETAA